MLSKVVSETEREELNTKYIKQGGKKLFPLSVKSGGKFTHTWVQNAAFTVYIYLLCKSAACKYFFNH